MIPITEENKCTITYSEDSKGFPSFYTYLFSMKLLYKIKFLKL